MSLLSKSSLLAVAALAIGCGSPDPSQSAPSGTKAFLSADRAIKIVLPSNWVTITTDDADRAFSSGETPVAALRVAILKTDKTNKAKTQEILDDIGLKLSPDPNQKVEASEKISSDSSLYVTNRYWLIRDPKNAERIALFSFSAVQGDWDSPRIKAERETLDKLIPQAQFVK